MYWSKNQSTSEKNKGQQLDDQILFTKGHDKVVK